MTVLKYAPETCEVYIVCRDRITTKSMDPLINSGKNKKNYIYQFFIQYDVFLLLDHFSLTVFNRLIIQRHAQVQKQLRPPGVS